MSQVDLELKAGDWVEVKSFLEIAETLGPEGTLDGLPFMPEMLAFCGRRFRVLRRAEKACFEMTPNSYAIQEFHNNDVVLLDGLRCSGADHDGCQRTCMLFWKEAWVRKAENRPELVISPEPSDLKRLGARLKTIAAPGGYICQATELVRATQPLTRGRILLKCLLDIRSGSRGLLEMAWLVLRPLWRKTTQWLPHRTLAGNLKRTPVGDLKLQPGEWVEIKSEAEIAQTLDRRGCNRGMLCDLGMSQYGGGKYRVRNRLDRMISEPTGEMRAVEGTVILDGLNCLCWNVVGGCPREDFMYWREVWLKRSNGHTESTKSTQIGDDGNT